MNIGRKEKKDQPIQLHCDFSEPSVLQLPQRKKEHGVVYTLWDHFPQSGFIFSLLIMLLSAGGVIAQPRPPTMWQQCTEATKSDLFERTPLGIISTSKSPKHVVISFLLKRVKPGGDEGVWVHGWMFEQIYTCQ